MNTYLRTFKLPETFRAPVILANLLTHTGGFDGRHIGMHARTKVKFVPLARYLAEWMPRRVMPPGTVISCNGFGMSLAGLIVEKVSQRPFELYVQDRIFQPLGMKSSSFFQPMTLR